MNSEPTIYVVDDDKAVRDSLSWLLESVGMKTRAYESAPAFLAEAHGQMVGCLVADLRLPGMSGLEMYEQMVARGISIATIFITGHGDVPVAVRAMKAGALDFIEKPFSDQLLLDRIREAMQQDVQRRNHHEQAEEVRQRFDRLTPREREVMRHVVAGRLNKQVAAELDLSHKTIEVHRAHVMEKMAADSLADLVRMSVVLGDTLDNTSDGAF